MDERIFIPEPTYYGEWKFDHSVLKARADRLVLDLPAVMEELGADHIVVHGTSGTMIAPVLLYLMPELRVVMIRKPREHCHGNLIEGLYGKYRRGLFLDDFVISGDTVGRVIDLHKCDVVGVLCHDSSEIAEAPPTRASSRTHGLPRFIY